MNKQNRDSTGDGGYRYFRVIQTGKNAYKCPVGETDIWSDGRTQK